MSRIELTEEQGSELAEYGYSSNGGGDPVVIDGHTYTYLDVEYNVDDHRWADTHLVVFERGDGKLFGMNYDTGSTENQENGFVYSRRELFEVEAEQITVTKYKEL